MGIVEFLVAVLSDATRSDVFPRDFPSRHAVLTQDPDRAPFVADGRRGRAAVLAGATHDEGVDQALAYRPIAS